MTAPIRPDRVFSGRLWRPGHEQAGYVIHADTRVIPHTGWRLFVHAPGTPDGDRRLVGKVLDVNVKQATFIGQAKTDQDWEDFADGYWTYAWPMLDDRRYRVGRLVSARLIQIGVTNYDWADTGEPLDLRCGVAPGWTPPAAALTSEERDAVRWAVLRGQAKREVALARQVAGT